MLLFAVVFQKTTRNKNCMMGTRKKKKRTTNEEAIKKKTVSGRRKKKCKENVLNRLTLQQAFEFPLAKRPSTYAGKQLPPEYFFYRTFHLGRTCQEGIKSHLKVKGEIKALPDCFVYSHKASLLYTYSFPQYFK